VTRSWPGRRARTTESGQRARRGLRLPEERRELGPDREARLAGPAGLDGFGIDVALRGNLLIAGADDLGPSSGACNLYADRHGIWRPLEKWLAPDGAAGDGFGSSVALGTALAAGGAPFEGTFANDAGAVYVKSDLVP